MHPYKYSRLLCLLGVLFATITGGIGNAYAGLIVPSPMPTLTVQLDAAGKAVVTAAAVGAGVATTCATGLTPLSLVMPGTTVQQAQQVGSEDFGSESAGGPPATLSLQAPAGTVFTAVDYAAFGSPTVAGCVGNTPEVKAIVGDYVLGLGAAAIPISVNTFPDYCGGTAKTLTVTTSSSQVASALTFTSTGTKNVVLLVRDNCGRASAVPASVLVKAYDGLIIPSPFPGLTVELDALGKAVVTAAAVGTHAGVTTTCAAGLLPFLFVVPGTAQQVSGSGSENFSSESVGGPPAYLHLVAPAGAVFTSVDAAAFGNPAVAGCVGNTPAVKSIVESYLLGKSAADIPISVNTFPDYCGGTAKTLTVTATSSQVVPTLTFTSTGTKNVVLLVRDNCGHISSVPASVLVKAYPVPLCFKGRERKEDRFLLCHKGKEKCVKGSEVAEHLAHGDKPGPCPNTGGEHENDRMILSVQAHPNPASNGNFQINVAAAEDGMTQVNFYNMQGTLISQMFSGNMKAGEAREFNVNRPGLLPGLYMVRVQNGTQASSLTVQIQ